MKLIFAGPTLHGADVRAPASCEIRPPARQGDIYRAVENGANVIGLIDGLYEYVPAVWHKEILYGLSKGVQIFGAASLGALRAAECGAFGMIGIGAIYESYANGLRHDDADVAQSHGPEEMRFLPLSEPLVNVEVTLLRCLELKLISSSEQESLLNAARDIFFKERTYRLIVETGIGAPVRAAAVLDHMRTHSINLKFADACLLMERVELAADSRLAPPVPWDFQSTTFWKSHFRGF